MDSKKVDSLQLSYRETLEPVVRARYEEKLKNIGGTDPYELCVKTSFSDEKKLLPSVTYPDIVNYLLFSPSPYTTDDLKSLKGLDAYNQSMSGWVSNVRAVVIGSKHVIRSKVLHSMRIRDKPLNPWSIVEPNGVIQASHCDCMAGLGEVCTHVAAMLFTVMEIVRIRDSTTVTQDPAYWKLPPSMKRVEYKEVRDIDFTSAKSLKRKFDRSLEMDSECNETPAKKFEKQIPKPTDDEIKDYLKNLHATGAKSAILSVTEEYSDEFVPTIEKQTFPKVLGELRNQDALLMNFGDLLKITDKVEISVSSEHVKNVEAATREQSGTKLWHDFRAGRVTASVCKQVCATDPGNPSQSLIMNICYPASKKLDTDATRWGSKNEKVAKERFLRAILAEGLHENVELRDCGLYLSEEKPHLAATPDAILSCNCCEKSVVEVKCPYNQRNSMLDGQLKDFYLKPDETGKLLLDKKHPYYYQVQTQLGVTKLKSAYFIVMTEVDIHMEQIMFDEQLWEEICVRTEKIFKVAILPELVGKFYSRLPGCGLPKPDSILTDAQKSSTDMNNTSGDEEEKWCYCDQVESGEMIACDNENCKIVWFHFACLKMDKPPKSIKWYCPDCRKLPEFKRSRARVAKK
ncbi:hypothetical protein DPMN_179353 [Dreissena polymorpha]|uniref:PHD-type domain-containing protein n=1 Tax=Dreissena polymorpha TaxID=45954 RepID=A0A9D4IKP7_DREPO|nr:hypothetical protein DPMN_179353 [Dreissena polymorpha]